MNRLVWKRGKEISVVKKKKKKKKRMGRKKKGTRIFQPNFRWVMPGTDGAKGIEKKRE